MKKISKSKYGFTLIELLVVVIIIAVLAAVALPQYKKSVMKSRFSTMMPVANNLAKAEEVYYLAVGEYTDQKNKLDVEDNVSTPEGININISTDPEYLSYVRVSDLQKVPNARYVVYQQHSANFAGTTMCEANDNTGKELCKSLGGVFVSDNGTERDWTSYLLSGQVGAGDAFQTSLRALSGDPVVCDGNWCTYTYTTGETVLETATARNNVKYRCDNSSGLCEVSEGGNSGDGVRGYVVFLRSETDGYFAYYDLDGNLIGGRLDRSWGTVSFDSDGEIGKVFVRTASNPYAVPTGATKVYYDGQGRIRQAEINGELYTYNQSGMGMNGGGMVSQYQLTSAQMAELVGNDNMNAITTYVDTPKCQEFPGTTGCSNP